MALRLKIGPIAADPSRPLWAWDWLRRSAPAVRQALSDMARRNGWDANAIACTICRESGGDPSAVNPKSGATGLIQFMPATAKALGTTTDRLGKMPAETQLAFVERYLKNALHSAPDEVGDYYMAVFWPAEIGSPDAREIARKGTKVYDQNAGVDWNGDGVLDVGDVKQIFRGTFAEVQARIAAGSLGMLDLTAPAVGSPPRLSSVRGLKKSGWWGAGLLVAAAAAAWWRLGR